MKHLPSHILLLLLALPQPAHYAGPHQSVYQRAADLCRPRLERGENPRTVHREVLRQVAVEYPRMALLTLATLVWYAVQFVVWVLTRKKRTSIRPEPRRRRLRRKHA